MREDRRPTDTKPPSASEWTPWCPLRPRWAPSAAVLAETLDGGQAFRWLRASAEPSALRLVRQSLGDGGSLGEGEQRARGHLAEGPPFAGDDIWTGVWSDCLVQLRASDRGVEWRAPQSLSARVSAELPRYLGAEQDWDALVDSLPWRSDPHLARCRAEFPGLRILRQPFGETLLGFLCSATKQIVQIKQMVALLALNHGHPLDSLPPAPSPRSPILSPLPAFCSLPTWAQLAAIPERDLRACQLGFRARFIHETASFLEKNPGWLETTGALPYPEAKARLMDLPGVGEKVADCVLLFGAGKLEAFPVDTWILKSLERRYGLVGWRPAQVAQFGRAHFGPFAGLAQQFLFAWERRFSRSENRI